MRGRPRKLLWKIWLSTSVALTVLFGVTGVTLQRHTLETTSRGLQEEVRASFDGYESLWKARSDTLASVASIVSSMPDVRAAFGTRHRATIRDTAGELWLKVSDQLRETAFFVVADPEGVAVATLDPAAPAALPSRWPTVREAAAQFPRQVSGVTVVDGDLFQIVQTPVYVDSPRGPGLIAVLVAGFRVDHRVAQRLKESTGGSEFLFLGPGRVYASTLNDRATAALASQVISGDAPGPISDGVSEYVPLVRKLVALDGRAIGRLCIFRSFDAARQRQRALRRNLVLMWLCAVAAGLGLTWLLVRRIVRPLEMLDRAAAGVAMQNYSFRVPVAGSDELGRLAATFNSMCDSLEAARQELIRQERISTIGRMATSIVHDLRNPLAAIYGGAEMMVDTELSPSQMKRLAANIYQASRRIQEMLHDLLQAARGRRGQPELCRLREVVDHAVEALRPAAEGQQVTVTVDVPEDVELALERSRIERVFLNLINNALEVLTDGGQVRIAARVSGDQVEIEVADSGPGIAPQIRERLFQPFVTGKKSGLGLGLALSRQSVLDHGGDMWAGSVPGGARFYIRLPLAANQVAVEAHQ